MVNSPSYDGVYDIGGVIWASNVDWEGDDDPTTELDSHANMVVVGKHSTIIAPTGKSCEVQAFSEECQTLKEVRIVDAAIAYDCEKTCKTFVLIMKNALHVPTMERNLIPPFIMREAGLQVNDVPRIHSEDLTEESHCIIDKKLGLRIPLRLRGVFSCFTSRKLTASEVEGCDELDIVFLTPDGRTWDPYDESYQRNEEHYERYGNTSQESSPKKKRRLINEDDHDAEIEGLEVSWEKWERVIDALATKPDGSEPSEAFQEELHNVDQDDPIRAQVADLSGVLDPVTFAEAIRKKQLCGHAAMAAGCAGHPNHPEDVSDELFLPLSEACATHAEIPKGVTKEMLAKVWRISEEEARRTLEVTTQLNRQGADTSLSRRVGTNDRMLRYRRLDSIFFMDTFFVTKKARSTRGYTMMQIFVSDKGFVKVYGMKSLTEIPECIKLFAKEVGAPNIFVCDPQRNQTDKRVREFCQKIGTTLRVLEEGTQHANRAELYIGLLKEGVRQDMRESHSPLRLWDYCAERRSQIFNLTAKDLFQLQGQNPHLATYGEMADISNLCNFRWYEWCYFRQHKTSFPYLQQELGRCLGPTKNEGNEMCQWVLQRNGKIVPRRTLRRLTHDEASPHNEVERRKREDFNQQIERKLGNSFTLEGIRTNRREKSDNNDRSDPVSVMDFDPDTFVPYESEEEPLQFLPEADIRDAAGEQLNQQSVSDLLINAKVLLPQGESTQMAKVVRRALDDNGDTIGTFDKNPILNTLVYDVEFPDGSVRRYGANLIAENILSQVDNRGRNSLQLEKIIGHRTNGRAVKKKDGFIVTKRGRRKLRQTTSGWAFHIQWRDGTKQWVPLKVLKESNPVEIAEYCKARDIADEPALAWWVPFTLRKRDRIIAAINSRVKKRTHKYGIEVPRSIEEAHAIDRRNGDHQWSDAIEKEMYNVGVAFEIMEDGEILPVGWSKSSGHIIFDVKMDFTRKARWVKDGHKHPDPESSNYAGVVSRESVRIALTYAALNGLDVLAADIRNAYLQAPSSEKHYVICGPEFGLENQGKRAKIVRALYGGKTAGRDFWLHLRRCMGETLNFKSCLADPDVWFREQQRPDGSKVYEYVLLYTDDCLVISDRAESTLREEIGKYFELKEESIGPPKLYLGGQMRQVEMSNGAKAWAFGSAQYVKAAVENVKSYLSKKGKNLPKKARTPLSSGYRPEIDVSDELEGDEATYYQSLIGVLRWMVELGRIDITVEVSMMSSHLALPRQGHLEQVYHMFSYLDKHHNAEMPFDPTVPEIDEGSFEAQDWSDSVYGEIKEHLPSNMPPPLGKGFRMTAYVDSDHAGDLVTRRSRTGFLVFLNMAPIYWMSKKQTTCETSTFGSEFVALKQATEYVRGLRYKLRMMGIPCEEPTYVYCDNQSVLANTTAPDSQLKKKSNSVAYHFVREGCAADEWRIAYINTHDNTADLLTKPLPSGDKRNGFVRKVLWWLVG